MKCIAVVDSNHSLMNFKLFGERGSGYRIDVDDATAKRREEGYWTMHKAPSAEAMLKWLLERGAKELPLESVRWLFYYVLNNEGKDSYALEDYMISKGVWRLPYFQRLDGRILSCRLDDDEEVWAIVSGEVFPISGKDGKTILRLFLEKFGKFEPFHIVSNLFYNSKMQQWETWESPIVYKFQPPMPLLVKRYEVNDEEWNLKDASIEYGWRIVHGFITTKGEQIENRNTSDVSATPVREWDVWTE